MSEETFNRELLKQENLGKPSFLRKKILKQPQKSIWGPHSFHQRKYVRHSVTKDVAKFVGWETIKDIVNATYLIDAWQPRARRNQALVITSFNLGSRISETLAARKHMFHIDETSEPPILIVSGMPLEKRYKKVSDYYLCDPNKEGCGSMENAKSDKVCVSCGMDMAISGRHRYTTEKLVVTRNEFSMRLDEPFVKPMFEWIDTAEDLLFPSDVNIGLPMSRQWAYALVSDVGDMLGLELWNHWLRSQRASCLAQIYGYRHEELLEWFEWTDWKTASMYSKLGPYGLAKRMGVKVKE